MRLTALYPSRQYTERQLQIITDAYAAVPAGKVDAARLAAAVGPSRKGVIPPPSTIRSLASKLRIGAARAGKVWPGEFAGVEAPQPAGETLRIFDEPEEEAKPAAQTPSVPLRRWKQKGDTAEVEQILSGPVQTLDDLYEAMEIDRTEWQINKWTANSWQAADGSPRYQVKAQVERNREAINTRELWKELIADLRRHAPRPTYPAIPAASSGNLQVIPLFDPHIGKRGRDGQGSLETESLIFWALEELIRKGSGYNPDRYVLAISEILHTDNGRTTTGGTPQDVDLTRRQAFRKAVRIARRAIDRLAERRPLDVVIEPGNHARESEWDMGELLAAVYEDNPRVNVFNEGPRQYISWGRTLLGFVHGNEEKHADLPLIMATDEPEAWAKSTFREWITGHIHKAKQRAFTPLDEERGVRVRIVSALSPSDDWHHLKGYESLKAAEALIYSDTTGYETHIAANVTREMLESLEEGRRKVA